MILRTPFGSSPGRSARLLVLSALAVGLVFGSSANARAELGREGTFAIGLERLFGIVTTSTDRDGFDADTTNFSFLWAGSPAPLLSGRAYDRPRLSFDYFVIDSLSLGGSLGFYTWSASDENDSDAGDGSGFLLAPRVGYMLGISERVGFWPRGGFTYVRDHAEEPDLTDTAAALSVEAPLVVGFTPDLAAIIALTLDLGLGGEIETDGPAPDVDEEHNQFGLQFGLVGFF